MEKCINKDELVDKILEIIRRGNDVKIRRSKNALLVIEEKQTIKYRTAD